MEIVTICVIASLLFMVFLIIQGLIKLATVKKELAEANAKVIEKLVFTKCNYDIDMKVLLDTIDEYSSNMSFTELKEYHNSRNIVNDKVFTDLTKRITLEVSSAMSEEYMKLVKSYVADPQLFIYEKVYYKVLAIVMDINKKNIGRLN